MYLQFRHRRHGYGVQVGSNAPARKFDQIPPLVPYKRPSPPANFSTLSDTELTVVTAYFDIGNFLKGPGGNMFTPQLYRNWMSVFARIRNPVVAYFDNADHAALMRILREKHPQTRIVVVNRRTLWSFRELEPCIAEIFLQEGYPWHPPNTVWSTYSAAMHAKYELMQWTIRSNPFNSAYICWLDIGLFRELATDSVALSKSADKSFRLGLPPDLNTSQIAYSLVNAASEDDYITAELVVTHNAVWVCGCFFVGRVDVMWQWTSEYLLAVEEMVSEHWISTDQQLIYWLLLGEGRVKLKPNTSLQLYHLPSSSNKWFYLGYLAKKAGEQHAS